MIVVDEQGNEYEATYPKRAKGLIKSGRARFVDENKICLACPPNINLEDNKMTDTNQIIENKTQLESKDVSKKASEYTKAFEEEFAKETSESSTKYTLDYALEQLEKVRNEASRFAVETREKISAIKSEGAGDVGTQALGEALLALVQEQEQIYRRLTDFYIGMVSDLKTADAKAALDLRKNFMDFVTDCVGASRANELPDFLTIWKIINS